MTRRAIVRNADSRAHLDAYLDTADYQIVGEFPTDRRLERGEFLIEGTDWFGWTLDGYVIPRLRTANIHAEEITDDLDGPGNAVTSEHGP